VNAQVRRGDRQPVDAHLASADLVVVADQVPHAVLGELLAGADVRAGRDLDGPPVLERGARADLAGHRQRG